MICTTVDLIRHGETHGGTRLSGITDDPLTDRGWGQMQSQCANQHWDAVISSPLLRCRLYAQQLSKEQDIPLFVIKDWQEMNFGAWEGRTASDIEQEYPGQLSRFYSDPLQTTIPGGESFCDFSTRIAHAWQTLLQQHPNRHTLVVTHGGVIRTLLMQQLAMPASHLFRLRINHACYCRIKYWQDTNGFFSQLVFIQPGPDDS